MLKKKVNEKIDELRERERKLPEMEQKLSKLETKCKRLERELQHEESLKGVGKVDKNAPKKRKKEPATVAKKPKKKVVDIKGNEELSSLFEGVPKYLQPVELNDEDERLAIKKRETNRLRKEIEEFTKEIEKIRDGKEIQNYWLDSAKYIWEFEQESKVKEKALNQMGKDAKYNENLYKFLSVLPQQSNTNDEYYYDHDHQDDVEPEQAAKRRKAVASQEPTRDIFDIIQPTLKNSSIQPVPATKEREIYAEYMCKVEHDNSRKWKLSVQKSETNKGRCSQPFCTGELIEDFKHEQMFYCTECGLAEIYAPEKEAGTFNEPIPQMQAVYCYKRKTHFRDWLSKAQGKENSTIPDIVYDSLLNELKKMRVKQVSKVTRSMIHDLLRKLKMPRYYHNASSIHFHITGKHPPKYLADEETRLMEMFVVLEPVFMQVRAEQLTLRNPLWKRENFFSYEYCIIKFCEIQSILTGDDTWLRNNKYFKLLKGKKKLQEADERWKMCVKPIGWPFIKSI